MVRLALGSCMIDGMGWRRYCLQAGSRPIQASEERFFAEYRGRGMIFFLGIRLAVLMAMIAPVIAILTKFDVLLDECQQEAEESGDFDDEEDEDQIFGAAAIIAERKFRDHVRAPLLAMPKPPSAVIRVSNGKCPSDIS